MGRRASRRGIACWRLRDGKRGMAWALIKRGGGRPGHAGFARGRRETRRRVRADGAGKKMEGKGETLMSGPHMSATRQRKEAGWCGRVETSAGPRQ